MNSRVEIQQFDRRLIDLYEDVYHAYEGRHGDVQRAIDDCREFLRGDEGELGPWERELVDRADTAVRSNFLCLAVVCLRKALAVSDLPRDEYEAGYSYRGFVKSED